MWISKYVRRRRLRFWVRWGDIDIDRARSSFYHIPDQPGAACCDNARPFVTVASFGLPTAAACFGAATRGTGAGDVDVAVAVAAGCGGRSRLRTCTWRPRRSRRLRAPAVVIGGCGRGEEPGGDAGSGISVGRRRRLAMTMGCTASSASCSCARADGRDLGEDDGPAGRRRLPAALGGPPWRCDEAVHVAVEHFGLLLDGLADPGLHVHTQKK
jgi:hypothetical protein